MVVIIHACPKCGCFDLRCQMWVKGWECFKCGLTQQDYEQQERKKFLRGITDILKGV